jgi:hypothetical protein
MRVEFLPREMEAMRAGEGIERLKAGVVPRSGIARARIPQADDEFRGARLGGMTTQPTETGHRIGIDLTGF